MSEENLTPEEEAEKAKLAKESESKDASELDDLLSSIDEEDDSKDIETLKKEVADLKKGVAKFFSEKGREKKEVKVETKPAKEVATESSFSPILKKLYMKDNPEIETVWDDIVKETPKGKDPIEYYESMKGWQLEAKARMDAKNEEETNKSKIDKPADGVVSNNKVDISKVKAEEVVKLTPSQKSEWVKAQAEKERNDAN